MKKSIHTLLMAAVIVALPFAFTSCEDLSDDNGLNPAGGGKAMPFSATISTPAGTRGLTEESDGSISAKWVKGEPIALIHGKTVDVMTVKSVNDKGVATIEGTINNATEGEEVHVVYMGVKGMDAFKTKLNAALEAESSEKPISKTLINYAVEKTFGDNPQLGTFEAINDGLDYRYASSTLTCPGSVFTFGSAVTPTSQLAVWKISLVDLAGKALSTTDLKVWDGDNPLALVDTKTALSVFYVVVPAVTSKNLLITATVGSDEYGAMKSAVTLESGYFYQSAPKMCKIENLTPLTLEAVNEGATMTITFENTLSKAIDLQYSFDGGQAWHSMHIDAGKPRYTDLSSNYHEESPGKKTLSGIKQILIKAKNESYGEYSSVGLDTSTEYERKLHISVDADCYIYGNMMSLVGGDQFASRIDLKEDRTFEGMFMDNKTLKSHPDKKLLLPATTLTDMCYRLMFWNCTALTVAPDLPAKVMKEKCYSGMFTGCSALTATPALPATSLAKSCYYGMFSNCSSLTSVSDLPAPKLDPYCYQEMFRGCTSLTKAPELLATEAAAYSCASMFWGCSALKTAPSKLAATVAEHCYDSMFDNCTFLESAPELPAMTMAPYCYAAMFRRCPSLVSAPDLPALTLANHCYDSMFFNQEKVPGYKLKNAPALPATTLADGCYTNMFRGCYSLTKAPDLLAKELKSDCYANMFYNCTSLNYLKCLATSIASDAETSPTYCWLNGVSGPGTFIKDKSVEYGPNKFWDTLNEYGSKTTCAAKVLRDGEWTVDDAN